MINLKQTLISYSAAIAKAEKLSKIGIPAEDRVIIITPEKWDVTDSGIYIPDGDKDDIPRRGVIVQVGPFTGETNEFHQNLKVGNIVTYGLYAGKEIQPLQMEKVEGQIFNVLSINEIVYIEENIK